MERFIRTKALLGEEAFLRLKNKTVAVFGIGGVGSYAAEGLVRSGIGTLYIYDNDNVAISNINRQLIATDDSVGRPKTEVARQRYLAINPGVQIIAGYQFITPESKLPFEKFDFIIDAVDNVTAKLFLIENAKTKNIPIISVMGTGNKLFPERLKVGDIYSTEVCPLCRVMRYELKKRGIEKLQVIWSDEKPIKPEFSEGETASGRPSPASCAFVPGSAGLMAASYAVRILLDLK